MRLTLKQLKGLQVETVSGLSLGHVHDLVFELDGQLIAQYLAKPTLISQKEYCIGRDQVVRFEEKKLIVDDTVRPAATGGETKKKLAVMPEPVATREEG